MAHPFSEVFGELRAMARSVASRAHAPYSQRKEAAVLLLSDGTWVAGVRVESITFSLTIPSWLNAFTTLAAAGRRDAVALALSRPFGPESWSYLADSPAGVFVRVADDTAVLEGTSALPSPQAMLPAGLRAPLPGTPEEGVRLARQLARHAYVPESNFRVGCVLETDAGVLLPGVNVEHRDWARILCAERNALGTAITYGLAGFRNLYLACPQDPEGSPCGACRQLLAEFAGSVSVWMDRETRPPAAARPDLLLPGSFSGGALRSQL